MYDTFITVTDQARKRKIVSIRPLVCQTSDERKKKLVNGV